MIDTSPQLSPLSKNALIVELFTRPKDAILFLTQLRKGNTSRFGLGIALRDRTPAGQLVAELALPDEAGAVTDALGGGLLGPHAKWLDNVGSVRVPKVGPVVVGGVFAAAFGLDPDIGSAARAPLQLFQAFRRLGLRADACSQIETALLAGKVLVAYNAESNPAASFSRLQTRAQQASSWTAYGARPKRKFDLPGVLAERS